MVLTQTERGTIIEDDVAAHLDAALSWVLPSPRRWVPSVFSAFGAHSQWDGCSALCPASARPRRTLYMAVLPRSASLRRSRRCSCASKTCCGCWVACSSAYLGVRTLLTPTTDQSAAGRRPRGSGGAYFSTLLLTLTNPDHDPLVRRGLCRPRRGRRQRLWRRGRDRARRFPGLGGVVVPLEQRRQPVAG